MQGLGLFELRAQLQGWWVRAVKSLTKDSGNAVDAGAPVRHAGRKGWWPDKHSREGKLAMANRMKGNKD